MNHPSGMPYGQPPMSGMSGPQRRHDAPYPPMPQNMRPQPGYQAYYHSHMGPPMPPYAPHFPQQWYQYPHMQQQHPPPPPPPPQRQYQHHGVPQHASHYAPLVVSSYPPPQVNHATAHGPQPSFPQQLPPPVSAPSPNPLKPPFSPAPPSVPSPNRAQQQTPPSVTSTPSEFISSTPAAVVYAKEPFYPPVPWLSIRDQDFPPRAPRQKRRIARSALSTEPIVFPLGEPVEEEQAVEEQQHAEAHSENLERTDSQVDSISVPEPTQTPTPLMSDAPSETSSTQPTTPSSAVPPQVVKSQQAPAQSKVRSIVPIVPAIPILPTSPTTPRRPHRDSALSTTSKPSVPTPTSETEVGQTSTQASSSPPPPIAEESSTSSEQASKATSPPVAPKSWAGLFTSKATSSGITHNSASTQTPNGLGANKSETLSDVLNSISPSIGQQASKIAFLEPRGLRNTGNMCYMNSVLQILVFCVPFYEFLDRIARKAAHNFKSDTPVVDAMIMFMREFSIIDSAESSEQLRLRLKPEDFERLGQPFIPEYVYSAIRDLPRFRDMRRGHQQDAQEFLGLLLEELHDECAQAMRSGSSVPSGSSTPQGSVSNVPEIPDTEGGWMEVGHKQKAAVTRSSGTILMESPITKIFGGKLRSELKVAGSKNSVTLEPYQPLQLDIGSPQVNNILDALKGLTRPESMQGDFYSSRGSKATATKQVFIETLPPILILHLKRFHYDSSLKQAEKIWKKVGYPLELEIPKEVFPVQTRNKMAAHGGFPKYRLTGVIYHHGKSTNGGHYTVDLRRQDGREWIRFDDTNIRRIRSEEVAEAGSEEDPKVLAAALERHKQQKSTSGNIFEQIDQEEEEDEEEAEKMWSQVNGHARSKSTMSTAVNGTSTPKKDASGGQTPNQKTSIKDNKVAYLLFYQRV